MEYAGHGGMPRLKLIEHDASCLASFLWHPSMCVWPERRLAQRQCIRGTVRRAFDAAERRGSPPNHAPARIISAAFSPIMMEGALVLPEVRVGMIEASATRRPSMPWTRSRSSTTAIGSEPILQVPTGW